MARAVIRVNARFVRRSLQRAARRAERMHAAFTEVGEIVLNSVRRNFAASGRPHRWKPRKDKRRSHKLLIDTSRLLNSITYAATDRHVDIGTNVIYAATHQYGRGAIPARPYLMIQDEDENDIREAILAHLTAEF